MQHIHLQEEEVQQQHTGPRSVKGTLRRTPLFEGTGLEDLPLSSISAISAGRDGIVVHLYDQDIQFFRYES
jgi:hypothetical protein